MTGRCETFAFTWWRHKSHVTWRAICLANQRQVVTDFCFWREIWTRKSFHGGNIVISLFVFCVVTKKILKFLFLIPEIICASNVIRTTFPPHPSSLPSLQITLWNAQYFFLPWICCHWCGILVKRCWVEFLGPVRISLFDGDMNFWEALRSWLDIFWASCLFHVFQVSWVTVVRLRHQRKNNLCVRLRAKRKNVKLRLSFRHHPRTHRQPHPNFFSGEKLVHFPLTNSKTYWCVRSPLLMVKFCPSGGRCTQWLRYCSGVVREARKPHISITWLRSALAAHIGPWVFFSYGPLWLVIRGGREIECVRLLWWSLTRTFTGFTLPRIGCVSRRRNDFCRDVVARGGTTFSRTQQQQFVFFRRRITHCNSCRLRRVVTVVTRRKIVLWQTGKTFWYDFLFLNSLYKSRFACWVGIAGS